MIEVEFFREPDGTLTGYTFSGHSDYAEQGSDIVCAAVSSAAYMAANTISVSKFPSMPIFTMRPSLTLSRISWLNKFFVPVKPFTTSWASKMVKFDSCRAVMQMVLLMGTRTFV